MSNSSENNEQLTTLQNALFALKKLRARLDAIEYAETEPIAIVGMSCRFPGGANDLGSFWRLLQNGEDAIIEVPADRWDVDEYYDPDPDAPGKMYTRWGGFLQHVPVDAFDAAFFGISPREAMSMDPQQRLLLEVAWEALEHAGLRHDTLVNSKTGVFIGMMSYDYAQVLSRTHDVGTIDAYHSSGNELSFAAGRLSYLLGLQGPSMVVQTACSSSLVAVHLACQSLRARECDLALAGGVNLMLLPDTTIHTCKFRGLSPDGRCKTFDAAANGYTRGEGCGIVALKRLSDAQSHGDPILALVRGSATNHDGPSGGLTVPNGLAQESLLRTALEQARITPSEVNYIEAHGTGTSLGDPIEVGAIAAVMSQGRASERPLMIGSVKTNIGHLEAAAGIAGLIKTVLALQHQEIPPHLHLRNPNLHIPWSQIAVTVPTKRTPWPAGPQRRIAGVSSFGLSGINAHVVLEEAPLVTAEDEPASFDRDICLLPMSARSEQAMHALAQAYYDRLTAAPQTVISLRDLCRSASLFRSHHHYRASVIFGTHEELVARLAAIARNGVAPGCHIGQARFGYQRKVVFVYPGQGSQWVGMARTLLTREPVFQAALAKCEQALHQYVTWSLSDLLLAETPRPELEQIGVIQPVLFAIQVALTALWRSWGIVPDAVVGHSMGEVAAAYVAGALSLDAATSIICQRSQLLSRMSGQGAMAFVELTILQAQEALAGYEKRVSIAANNGPRATVLSGDAEALRQIMMTLEQRNIFCRLVKVDVASHSPQVDSLCDDLLRALDSLQPQPTMVRMYSTVTGSLSSGEEFGARYWVDNLRQPVLFADTVKRMLDDQYDTFVEISPHPILLPSIEDSLRHMGANGVAVLPSLRRDEDEQTTLMESLGVLYTLGVNVDWAGIYPHGSRRVDLPMYPWQRKRYWVAPKESLSDNVARQRRSSAGHPLLGQRVTSSMHPSTHFWEVDLGIDVLPYLGDHRVQGTIVLPATAYLEMAIAATTEIFGAGRYSLGEIAFKEALGLTSELRTVQIAIAADSHDVATFQIASHVGDTTAGQPAWILHACGTIHILHDEQAPPLAFPESLDDLQTHCIEVIDSATHYQTTQRQGLEYGPNFQGVQQIWLGRAAALGRLQLPEGLATTATAYHCHPALLDSGFQLLATVMLHHGTSDQGTYVPVGLKSLRYYRRPESALWGYAQARSETETDGFEGDLLLVNDEQQIVLEVRGLQAKRLATSVQTIPPHGLLDCLYELQWHIQPAQTIARVESDNTGYWLIMADDTGVSSELERLLESHGAQCIVAVPGDYYARIGTKCYQLNPRHPEDFQHLLHDAFSSDRLPCRAIIHLWSLRDIAHMSSAALQSALQQTCASVLHLTQALVQTGWRDLPRLWLITRGAQAVETAIDTNGLAQVAIWGLGRTIMHEHPEVRCTCVDIDQRALPDDPALFIECWSGTTISHTPVENQIVLRYGARYVARLAQRTDAIETTPSFTSEHLNQACLTVARDRPFRLEIASPGILDNLMLRETCRVPPGPGEVEIEVYAAGLNFLDVLSVMGIRPDSVPTGTVYPGAECAGIIVAVGEDIQDYQVGDPVIAVATGCFARFVTTPANFVVHKPAQLSFEEAAALPITTMTAYYALRHQARLARGERVLIHSAAGGTGVMALQIAQHLGAEVFATAGSVEKRAFLQSLGIRSVSDSRSPAFAADILAATNGRGVDVVLNSLTGEAAARSLALLAPFGRFLEISKRDIYEDKQLGLWPFHKNLSYFAIDLAHMAQDRPEQFGSLLHEVIQCFVKGHLTPPPLTIFPIGEAVEAFRTMAQAKHIGKIVVTLQDSAATMIAPARRTSGTLQPDATYLITGGLGGLGLAFTSWMVANKARHLVLVGRSAPSAEVVAQLDELRRAGAQIVVAEADVTQVDQLASVLQRIEESMPPLRGIIHGAAVLDDGTVLKLTEAQLMHVLAPKVLGAWNLHTLTQHLDLDFFVLFSSAASLLGSPGQSNYAAANAFLDALAQHRRSHGLCALSINWGPWTEVGLAAAQSNRGERISLRGMGSISPSEGVALLGTLLEREYTQIGVMPLDMRRWCQFYPRVADLPFLELLLRDQAALERTSRYDDSLRIKLLAAEPSWQRHSLLMTYVQERVAHVLRLAPTQIDPQMPLRNLGIDSLMGLELRNQLEDGLGLTLSATLVWMYPTVAALVPYLAEQMGIIIEAGSEPQAPVTDQQIALLEQSVEVTSLLDALEGLSRSENES